MSDSDPVYNQEAEKYAYSVTRKVFYWTAGGLVAFAGWVIIFFL